MKKTLVVFALFVLAGCASSDYDQPPQRGRGMGEPPSARATDAGDGMNFIPLTDWWHEPSISGALNLSNDQFARLDRISADQHEEIARLERDSGTAMRDFRRILDSDRPADEDIRGAAQRARALRDDLFDRQVRMIAAEREVLTQQQWRALQQQLQSERSQRRGNESPRRGRGGRGGGRGRWPGN